MTGLDLFAWIVLLVLIAALVVVFCPLGWLPGHVAKSRGHPRAEHRRRAWAWLDLRTEPSERSGGPDARVDHPSCYEQHRA